VTSRALDGHRDRRNATAEGENGEKVIKAKVRMHDEDLTCDTQKKRATREHAEDNCELDQ
jgi:hypothetical protein